MKYLLFFPMAFFAMQVCFSQAPKWQGKFEQLGPETIPTPNSYRTGSGAPGPNYWQQRADYVIDVEVNDETHLLTANETITYYNNAPENLSYLWLQLDQNLFAEDNMTNKTQPGVVRDSIPAKFFGLTANIPSTDYKGGYTIKSVKDASGKSLPYVINNTMMRVDLPAPIKTGEKFIFSIAWSYTEYDRNEYEDGRGGYEYFPEDGNYLYTFAQWFPRMCVFDDYEGWQNKQFLGKGEFALTFGNYKVKITVPSDHIVGATGMLVNPKDVLSKEQLDRLEKAKKTFDKPVLIVTEDEVIKKEKTRSTKKSTWEFSAENVRDFAFAHSRKFIWDAMAVKIGDYRTPLAQSLYPKEGNPLWEKESTLAVKNALEVYSKRTIDYPYPVAYSVHTANQGMEYPMICFNGGRPDENGHYSQQTLTSMVHVIVHEVGHNFFPMIVNSDERQSTWMDEGLNSFLDKETLQERYPQLNYMRGTPKSIVPFMRGDKTQMRPVMATADNQSSNHGPNGYTKPAAALTILRETVMGKDLFDKAFKEYAQRWAFKHPKPADFFRTMEDASAVDLDWFWKGWFFTTDNVDIEVNDVKWFQLTSEKENPENKKIKAKKGDLNAQSNTDFSSGPQPFSLINTPEASYGEFKSKIDDNSIRGKLEDKNIYQITFKNLGGLVTPLIIEWTYKDGSKETEKIPAEIWRVNESEATKVFVKDKEVVSVILDPNFELADVDMNNNLFPKKKIESKFDQFKKKNN